MNNRVFTLFLGICTLATTCLTSAQSKTEHGSGEPQYYRHIMFRETPYASYRGIYPLGEDARADAAHYVFSHDEQGRVKEIRYQINGNLIRGNEVFDSFIWFAPKVKIAYAPKQETHTYFNVDDQQVAAHGNVYRAVYDLDDQGQRVALRFYDQQGNKSGSEWLIHRYAWRHEGGKVFEKRFNLADEQQTLRPAFQFHEVALEYDNDGKLMFVRNLGLNGEPANNDSGAGIDRIIYDHNGNFVRWQVYDKDGLAVEGNRPMVHMGEHLYDPLGNKVGLRGYDRSGNRMAFSWGAYEHVRGFNAQGNQDMHKIYSAEGVLDRHLQIEYSADHNEMRWLKSLNDAGELVASPMLGGAAAMEYVYKNDGTVDRQFFNPDMTKYVRPEASAGN